VRPSNGLRQKLQKVLIVHLQSQSKLPTPRRENRKIRHEIEILEHALLGVATSDLSNDNNKLTSKSRETIPLKV
jgi:hypothetical protein